MATSYDSVINLFLSDVEKDVKFFNYFGKTDEEALALAKERSQFYMDEAVSRIMLDCKPSVDFTNRDSTAKQFNFDLTEQEKLLLRSLMYEYYMFRDVAYLKTQTTNYAPKEVTVFSPDNARTSFMDMYKTVCEHNEHLIDEYRNTDRQTGEYIGVDYSALNADAES